MQTTAIMMSAPHKVGVAQLGLTRPTAADLVIDITHSGISTGTEGLFWSGKMPPFPGMGYPLVPGYESTGTVVEAGADCSLKVGDTVFVPGANCYDGARGLFGGAAKRLISAEDRVTQIDPAWGAEGALLALAATARHALAGPKDTLPDLIIGHGVLGRLLARITVALGGTPTVWEVNADRTTGAQGYTVLHPDEDDHRDYMAVYDASGRGDLLNDWITRIGKGGEIVLAGFYTQPLSFAFPPAFMKEARFRIAAEWNREDLHATRDLVENGALSLADLITHTSSPDQAGAAYETAFTDPNCLKMILDWSTVQ